MSHTVIDMQAARRELAHRMQFAQSITALSSAVLKGTTFKVNFVAHAKAMGWTIKSASKERALIDIVAVAIKEYGYTVRRGGLAAQALSKARQVETARREARQKPRKQLQVSGL